MGRRPLLHLAALLVLVVLAGCLAPGSLTMEPVTDAEIADHASTSLEHSGDSPPATPDREVRMLRDALENGSGTIEAPSAPVETERPFEHDGAYYDLDWTVVDEREATSVSLVVDFNETDPEGRRIDFADLPAPDRRALSGLLPPEERHREEGVAMGTATIYDDAELEGSVLAPEQRYDVVVYEGEPYAVELDGTREVTLKTYRYTSAKVAEGTDAFAADLKAEYLFTLSGLSPEERDVVESAVDDDYYADDDDDRAFQAVVDRFTAHERVRGGDTYGEWLVRYDGQVYWANLEYGGYAGG